MFGKSTPADGRKARRGIIFFAAAFTAGLLATQQASAQSFTEFAIPTANSSPIGLTIGPDGNIWFVEQQGNKVGRMTPGGSFMEFTALTAASQPGDITAGPDGNLWFASFQSDKISRITPAGVITDFPIPTATPGPGGIVWGADNAMWFTEVSTSKIGRVTVAGAVTEFNTVTAAANPFFIGAGPDGNVWFTETKAAAGKIARITPSGTVTEFPMPTADGFAITVAAGADGALWFTENAGNKIARVTTAGVFTEFPLPNAGSGPRRIVLGLDGAMWFTEGSGNRLGRITPAGTITEFTLPVADSSPFGITAAADGTFWYTAANTNKIGHFTPAAPGATPLVASILPTSRSVQVGNFATVFATIINSGSNSLTNCRIAPAGFVNGFFTFQTTNPSTNALTGAANTGAPISPHALQTYLLAFKAGGAFAPGDVKFNFVCDDTASAIPITGVNTLQLVFDTAAVADMIAVGVTPSNDGFARTGGNSGTGVFAVATTNIGPATQLTAKARLSNTGLPLTVTLCETNASAQCKAPPAATVTRSFGNNEASTFSVFLQASGAITADPATNRVFLEFLDGGNIVRGSTSTAVTTQ